MTSGTVTTTIHAKPEVVWGLVADLGTHAAWSPKPYTIEWTQGQPNQVGSVFHSVGWVPGDKNHANEGEITERAEPTRFALRANDQGAWVVSEFDLKAVGDDATEVTHSLTFPKMKGMSAVLLPVLFPIVGMPNVRKRMALLKAKAEGAS